ncbi:glutaconyl-CoA decarboxylase subunit beta [Clostridia bacterium]|nr:glutaconyl-CoA decarboxylase subunit beta [Clostridia bacterium]GHV10934.1 glutaconyl-CoA decarboxylase subunit beta [Clostridia bacterium]
MELIAEFFKNTGLAALGNNPELAVKTLIMFVIIGVLFYLAVVRKFEPLLLLPIAFGMLLGNLPGSEEQLMLHMDWYMVTGVDIDIVKILNHGGLVDILYMGVKFGLYPSLIFIGVGAMTDFSALIANPKSLLLGAAAQFGIYIAFVGAIFLGFDSHVAAAIGIIGGADGPTAIYVTKILAPTFLGAIAVAAYSYMALVPIIQPPIMRAFTSKKNRMIVMENLRPVSKMEQVIFPIIVAVIVCLILPDATSLIGAVMFGNLLRVSGVTERLSKTAQNELINIVTIFLGVSVGATAQAENFLSLQTIEIIVLGLCAFACATFGGIMFGNLMCKLTGGKVNPLIGSAGVSAVPMAARVSQVVGQKDNPSNFLLMHAMGPNVAGVIGSAVAAGVFLTLFKA